MRSAAFKRLFDVVVSGATLVLLAPVICIVALAVLLDSGLPIIFRQSRVGKDFRHFKICKFRTMRAVQPGPSITVSGDRRVTRVGKFLRATKLDELPQFWNVFKGDMSLVGPRPELPEYVEMFAERYKRILTVRPGITDFASIRFRSEEEILAASPAPLEAYAKIVLPSKLDLAEQYVQQHNMRVDLSILFQTLIVTLSKNASARHQNV